MGEYQSACNRLNITYGDVDGLEAEWSFVDAPTTGAAAGVVLASWESALDKLANSPAEGCNVP